MPHQKRSKNQNERYMHFIFSVKVFIWKSPTSNPRNIFRYLFPNGSEHLLKILNAKAFFGIKFLKQKVHVNFWGIHEIEIFENLYYPQWQRNVTEKKWFDLEFDSVKSGLVEMIYSRPSPVSNTKLL